MAEYDKLVMPQDEYFLDMRDLQLARNDSFFGAPYRHPLKPPIAPSAPFELRRVPYGAFRDAAFADLIGVENGFICSLLKYRYRQTPAVQGMQLKDITLLIWHCQNNWDWYVFSAFIIPLLNPVLSPETFLGIIYSLDVFQGLLSLFRQARLTLKS